jgi:hypothetical protein
LQQPGCGAAGTPPGGKTLQTPDEKINAHLVEGTVRRSDLLTLGERKNRLGLIVRLSDKEKSTITAALMRALKHFARTFRSLTPGQRRGVRQPSSDRVRPWSSLPRLFLPIII